MWAQPRGTSPRRTGQLARFLIPCIHHRPRAAFSSEGWLSPSLIPTQHSLVEGQPGRVGPARSLSLTGPGFESRSTFESAGQLARPKASASLSMWSRPPDETLQRLNKVTPWKELAHSRGNRLNTSAHANTGMRLWIARRSPNRPSRVSRASDPPCYDKCSQIPTSLSRGRRDQRASKEERTNT